MILPEVQNRQLVPNILGAVQEQYVATPGERKSVISEPSSRISIKISDFSDIKVTNVPCWLLHMTTTSGSLQRGVLLTVPNLMIPVMTSLS